MALSTDKRTSFVPDEPRYQERISKWEALWNLENADRPRWLWSTPPFEQPLYSGRYPLSQFFRDKAMQLEGELENIAWREALDIDDLFVPFLQPCGGVTVFASAFGCQVDFFNHTLPWAHPAIKASDPAQKVYDLLKPAITNGQLGQMLEFTDYFVTETKGCYPIALTDLQGPMDTAYLIWDSSEFMMAMYSHPDEVHHLMRMVTDLIIDYIKEQRELSQNFIPCHYPPLYLPDGEGIAISDDALAVLSPKTYEEFSLPYVNELSEEFGGILIHSCGNFTHQIDNLKKVRKLRGLNFGASETPFEALWEHFNGKTTLIPHLGLNKDIHFNDRLEYVEHVLNNNTHNRGLLILLNLVISGSEPLTEHEPIRKIVEELILLIDRYA